MATATSVSGVRSVSTAALLLARQGIEGTLRPIAPEAVGDASVRRSARLERAGLEWLLLESRAPSIAARRAARAAIRRGDTVALLVVGADTLALTVALDSAPIREIARGGSAPDDHALLARLAECAQGTALEAALRLVALLALEPAGDRFVRRFRETHALVAEALPAGPGPLDRHALALLQLTRVLFLYFVQSKGWLDEKADYLAQGVDACLGQRRQIHRDFLYPLFFGTLNRPFELRRGLACRLGRVPYLNGGLFEPHPLERRWRTGLPNDIWRQAFDELFERFAFCTREGGGDADIAPDMLGRVFEGIMDPTLRQRSGSFYTPPALVELLLGEGLCAVLQDSLRIPYNEAVARLAEPDATVRDRLAALTLLDPAAGSGAFLLAALVRLAQVTRAPHESIADARRRTLGRSIYGVDLNPVAVRLAELRLWLAVIAEDSETDPAKARALPNLDSLLRQGDSLHAAFEGVVRRGTSAERLLMARSALFAATGSAKRAALRALRVAERMVALDGLRAIEATTRERIRETLATLRSPDLFGERGTNSATARQVLSEARSRLRQVRRDRRRIELYDQLPAFDYAVQFADVLAGGGFDLVIGNPPWVRGESVPAHTRERLAARYRWFRRSGPGWRNAPDLSIAFLERSFEIARPGGAVAMLAPAKLCAAGYASRARHELAAATTLHLVAPVPPEKELRFQATTYPLVLVAGKKKPTAVHEVRTSLRSATATVRQETLRSGAPWILDAAGADRIWDELAAVHPPLARHVRIQLGLKTGADRCFITDRPDLEPELMRRAVRGRDVRAFRVEPQRWLRWPCDPRGHPLSALPPLATAHFSRWIDHLQARADYHGGPPWTLFRTRAATAANRVIWPDLARGLRAVALSGEDDAGLVPLNTCYVIALPDPTRAAAMAAWLNSTFARVALERRALPAANRYFRFTAATVGALPTPPNALADATLAELARAARGGEDIAAELDARVAVLLGLDHHARHQLGASDRAASR